MDWGSPEQKAAQETTGCVSETDLCHSIAVPGKFTKIYGLSGQKGVCRQTYLAVVHREKIEEQPSPEGILPSISSGFVFFVN